MADKTCPQRTKNVVERSKNMPTTLWNKYLCINKYLFHNIVSTLTQRYTMTQHLSNAVWTLYTKQLYHNLNATLL